MEMRITKNSDKPHLILYTGNNGTATWMHTDDFFVRHDLSHYAIEKTAGYTTAFMGMLNNGMGIRDFEDRQKRLSMTITKEAWYAANMANLFLIEIAQGNFDDFNKVAAEAFANMGLGFPFPAISPALVNATRDYLRQLLNAWQQLPAGKTMVLNFDL